MKKFTWKKLNFSDDTVHDPSTSQRPCFTEINSCMKKNKLKIYLVNTCPDRFQMLKDRASSKLTHTNACLQTSILPVAP